MSVMMRSPETRNALTFVVTIVFIVPASIYAETCNRLHWKGNVTVDSRLCSFKNYTEPVPKGYCFKSCFDKQWCTRLTTSPGIMVNWCCLVNVSVIQYRQPGDMVLYYRKGTPVTCQTGWGGKYCDVCALNFEPFGKCDKCLDGWTGDSCDACADRWLSPTCDQICDGFGCCYHSQCQGCIQNGRWEGTVEVWPLPWHLEVRLTFTGETCSEISPGTVSNAGFFKGTVEGGNLNEAANILRFTNSRGYTYKGTIAMDKTVNGNAKKGSKDYEFSMSYVPHKHN